MTTSTCDEIGLYLEKALAGNEGLPGAPLLHLHLMVNATNGKITGQAAQTQAVASPYDKIEISNVTGQIQYAGLAPYTKLVALKGEAAISLPAPEIGTYIVPFEASFAINDNWEGKGGWTLGKTIVKDVPIKTIK